MIYTYLIHVLTTGGIQGWGLILSTVSPPSPSLNIQILKIIQSDKKTYINIYSISDLGWWIQLIQMVKNLFGVG